MDPREPFDSAAAVGRCISDGQGGRGDPNAKGVAERTDVHDCTYGRVSNGHQTMRDDRIADTQRHQIGLKGIGREGVPGVKVITGGIGGHATSDQSEADGECSQRDCAQEVRSHDCSTSSPGRSRHSDAQEERSREHYLSAATACAAGTKADAGVIVDNPHLNEGTSNGSELTRSPSIVEGCVAQLDVGKRTAADDSHPLSSANGETIMAARPRKTPTGDVGINRKGGDDEVRRNDEHTCTLPMVPGCDGMDSISATASISTATAVAAGAADIAAPVADDPLRDIVLDKSEMRRHVGEENVGRVVPRRWAGDDPEEERQGMTKAMNAMGADDFLPLFALTLVSVELWSCT